MRVATGVLCAVAVLAATDATTVDTIFNISVDGAIFTSASVTRHAGASPNFAVASYLNQPEFIEVFNTSSVVWSFSQASGTYIADQARHAESAGLTVDTFGAVITSTGTTVYGFSSTGSGVPAWQLPLPGCSSDTGGGTYTGIESSDSGNLVAFFCPHSGGSGAPTARVYGINGQTGEAWHYDLGPTVAAGQGQVQVTADGSWVLFVNEGGKPTPNTATAYVLDGSTGQPRGQDNITIPFFITAAISDSGNYVATGDDGVVHVWEWAADVGAWSPAYDLTPPAAAPGGWIPWDLQMSTGTDAEELVIAGCISGDVRTVQVSAWSLVGGALRTNWVSQTNPSFQENPTVRADGPYIAVALWGDVGGDAPTTVLLVAGSNSTVMTATSPGSMFAVDVAVDSSSASQDVVLLTAAGKAVPANEAGNGGNAYGWRVTVNK